MTNERKIAGLSYLRPRCYPVSRAFDVITVAGLNCRFFCWIAQGFWFVNVVVSGVYLRSTNNRLELAAFTTCFWACCPLCEPAGAHVRYKSKVNIEKHNEYSFLNTIIKELGNSYFVQVQTRPSISPTVWWEGIRWRSIYLFIYLFESVFIQEHPV